MRLKRHRKLLAKRSQWLARIGQGLLLLLAGGYWSVQVVNGEHFRDLADGNRLRKVSVSASRGLILDRHGEALAENTPAYTLWLDRSRTDDVDATVSFAAKALDRNGNEMLERLHHARRLPAFKPIALAAGLSLEHVARIAAHQLEYPELEVRAEPVRLHRFAHQTAHVLGYLGEASDRDLGDGPYRPGDLVGKKGIEKAYETVLRGRSGERVVEVDSRGRITGDGGSGAPARSGHDLRLTLDLRLQQEASRLLEDKVGSIIALDPRSGEILAMASSPGFDPNRFARGLDTTTWRNLLEHPDDPLQNRSIQNTYPPGSVFKIVMAIAALEAGHDPHQRVFCGGYSRIYGHRYRCWHRGGHGSVDLREALKESCNVYFHHIGQRLEIDTIAEVAQRFGFGRATGLDIGGEKSGLVPTEAWSQRRRGMPWYAGETISVATGQGPLLVTPLQVANMMSAIANGGRMPRPRLRFDPAPEQPVEDPFVSLVPSHLAFLRDALWAVVNEEGTGKAARLADFDIVGKTGTAQVVRQETWTDNDQLAEHHRDHAWFASYGPVEDPRLVVVAFVEHGGGGSTAAAPLAASMFRRFLELTSDDAPSTTTSPFSDGPQSEPLRVRLPDRTAP
ncbi:MAG: penicillin-binding protein 2 [Acidobacteriota bacterium]